LSQEAERGILICGTGLGMSMVANRFRGIRAALCHELFTARMARLHNDANILVLGGRVIGDVLALEMVKVFLETPFEGGRHARRVKQIDELTREEP
ncbi:MAG: RpiB/LacA/LacB family sugar-phosphate isomerase, partial [Thermodesulfobacteria bacterium]|nr:RpiB/LacA/LacB family sugar-phosphate isomerase [Thermodesulfobacteriota bacterium]